MITTMMMTPDYNSVVHWRRTHLSCTCGYRRVRCYPRTHFKDLGWIKHLSNNGSYYYCFCISKRFIINITFSSTFVGTRFLLKWYKSTYSLSLRGLNIIFMYNCFSLTLFSLSPSLIYCRVYHFSIITYTL